jgi:ribosome-associated protein
MARKQSLPPDPAETDDDAWRDAPGDADDEFADEGPSKSELKRQDRELRALGVQLVELPATALESLDLPEKLFDAVTACRSITAHGARLRQEMYIAKVMRHVDVEPIRAALARRSEMDRQRVRREHALERWRDRLLADEADAWTELAAQVGPGALQPLRALARQARAEKEATKPPAAARQLFRRLRELLENTGIQD